MVLKQELLWLLKGGKEEEEILDSLILKLDNRRVKHKAILVCNK